MPETKRTANSSQSCRDATALAGCLVAMCGLAFMPAAQAMDKTAPVMFAAESLHYEEGTGLVIAEGRVEIMQGERLMLADRLEYDQAGNRVVARGNISILEPDGSVFFAQQVELRDNLKTGVVHHFQARLSDESRFAAREAHRVDEHTVKLKNAVYSPCEVCEDDPVPLWQIKADAVKIDTEAQKITYHSAFLEWMGVPVLYTPYLSHATPNADRKSGLLRGRYRASNNLGAIISLPYYFNIAPEKDFTLTTTLTGLEGPVFSGKWRHLTPNGRYELYGSVTYPQRRDGDGTRISGNEFRGHIEGIGQFTLNDTWKWGFEGKRSSDDTYLRLYRFGYEDLLTSRAYLEAQRDRSYAIVEAVTFQGLNPEDDPDSTPLVLPSVEMAYLSDPGFAGTQWFFDAGSAVLSRHRGVDSARLSANPGWILPVTTDGGHLLTATAELVTDLYLVNDLSWIDPLVGRREFDGLQSRVMPQISLGWSYPLVRHDKTATTVLEPRVQFVASPNGNNPIEIPNEDSLNTDFSSTNLFARNRFNGYDRVETGPRVNYGIQTLTTTDAGNFYRFFAGQSYAPSRHNLFPLTNDNTGYFSDYLGEVELGIGRVNLAYRFQLDAEGGTLQRNEINARVDWNSVDLYLDYILLDDDPVLPNKEEVSAIVAYDMDKNWRLLADTRRDLSDDGGMIHAKGGVEYRNECITFTASLQREFTRVREIEPSTSLSFQIALKNL